MAIRELSTHYATKIFPKTGAPFVTGASQINFYLFEYVGTTNFSDNHEYLKKIEHYCLIQEDSNRYYGLTFGNPTP